MSCFLNVLEQSEAFDSLSSAVTSGGKPVGAVGLSEVGKALAISSLCEKQNKRALVITPDEASAVKLCENLNTLMGGVLLYPARDFSFVQVAGISHEYEQIRLGVLSRMAAGDYNAVVCSVQAACQMTMPPEELKSRTHTVSVGDEIDIKEIEQALVQAGYTRYDQVDGTSQFAVRGGIVDVFPPGSNQPVRLEFWGDTVDTISSFDLSTQRRSGNLQSLKITPSAEVLFSSNEKAANAIDDLAKSLKGKAIKARESLYDDSAKLREGVNITCRDRYLPLIYKSNGIFDYCDGLLIACDSSRVKEKCQNAEKLMHEDIKWLLEDGTLCKGLDKFTISFSELTEIYSEKKAVYLDSMPRGSFDTPVAHLSSFTAQTIGVWSGTLAQLKEELSPLTEKGYTVCIMAGTERAGKALAYDLNEMGFYSVYYEQPPSKLQKGTVSVLPGTLSGGIQISEIKFALFTHARSGQLSKKKKKARSKDAIHSLDELSKGDYIVHNVHGIGIFEGIHSLEINNVKKDYIKISYAKGDTLYVPVTQLDLVSKYIGPKEDTRVKVNRLGSGEWQKTKAKVRASVRDMAKELIALYAKRMSTKGYAFSKDTDLQRDFELRFAYEETEDQLRSSEEIKSDMERAIPMDRLLCGDVGFGKTEVALRSAFKCIGDGKQCAILVPTTVLAMQHFQTALKRMEPFPVRVEMLSRFVSPAKQKEVLEDLAAGKVDLLVGTHRIISKDIKFADLGLLIVDEEQRFGVAQKEKLKAKFPKVDVLTLSATPIPRTLNMALSGIRDMSVLEEAPGDRHPVQTYVMEYDFGVLVEAIEKELARGGQCYYLHNNIDTIDHVAVQIKKEIPSARVGVAHGRMTQEQLSDVWQQLLEAEIDVLVCTTIIETGVDVPNVNTLIIENADRMGLAQLHQIRGRVGRSSRRAYAYFTFSRGKELSDIATKRLEAIREYTEFGSGFKIAMRDLEIRGAGSLLGSRQHGHMEAVGYEMYLKLLEDAVAAEKGERREEDEERECLIDLPVDANIPETYIVSTSQRISMYKRIADIRSDADANDVYDELTDRFGVPPASVYGLVEIALLRNRALALQIYEISQKGGALRLYVNEIQPKVIGALNLALYGRVSLSAGKRPYIAVKLLPDESVVDTVRCAIEAMEKTEKADE